PSIQELRRRLRERKTDDETEIEKRLRRLNEEYEKSKYFDYVIVNDDLNTTVSQIEDIIQKHQREAQHVSK
ncbi:MAG: guanylate kinase, partial [Calditrichia bacterium]